MDEFTLKSLEALNQQGIKDFIKCFNDKLTEYGIPFFLAVAKMTEKNNDGWLFYMLSPMPNHHVLNEDMILDHIRTINGIRMYYQKEEAFAAPEDFMDIGFNEDEE